MKILMFGWEFPPFNSGGLGTACYGLTKGIHKIGPEIIFVLPRKIDSDVDFVKLISIDRDKKSSKKYLVNSILSPYVNERTYQERIFYEKSQVTSNASLYGGDLLEEVERYALIGEEIAKEEEFDVIHAHDWLTFKAGIAAKKVSGKSLVVHVHATEFDRTGGNGVNQYVYEIEKRGLQEADAIIAVSKFTKQKIVDHYGISPEKISVVHNGIEFQEYSLEKIHSLRKNNKIVLFLGRITIQKGPDYFVYAAKKVLDVNPNVIFVLAGSGDMHRFIIEKVAELGIADKFIFTGFLRGKDLESVYKMADLYVMPSVSEPFGITPLESLMNGTPVLISKQSGISEVLTHCLKVDFWDVDEMANKMLCVLEHSSLHECLTQNGRAEVKKITWDESARKCMEVYNSLVRRSL